MENGPPHPRQQLAECMRSIYELGLTTTSGGNLSVKDDDGTVWVTPARLDKASLSADDIVAVSQDGEIVEGIHAATSELPFHLSIYDSRPDIRAIVHAHPIGLVAYSAVKRRPDTRGMYPVFELCGDVALAAYAAPGSEDLGRLLATETANGANCLILEHHGVVTVGDSLSQAFARFEVLEHYARMFLTAARIGKPKCLTAAELERTALDTRHSTMSFALSNNLAVTLQTPSPNFKILPGAVISDICCMEPWDAFHYG